MIVQPPLILQVEPSVLVKLLDGWLPRLVSSARCTRPLLHIGLGVPVVACSHSQPFGRPFAPQRRLRSLGVHRLAAVAQAPANTLSFVREISAGYHEFEPNWPFAVYVGSHRIRHVAPREYNDTVTCQGRSRLATYCWSSHLVQNSPRAFSKRHRKLSHRAARGMDEVETGRLIRSKGSESNRRGLTPCCMEFLLELITGIQNKRQRPKASSE